MVRVISHNGFGRVRMALHLRYTSSIAGIFCRDRLTFADNASVDDRVVTKDPQKIEPTIKWLRFRKSPVISRTYTL